jgi:RNA polymerase sigma-70 factor (ECF subfamily)
MPAPDLERAYTDHAASVFAFALTLTRAEGEARDVLQEVFVKLAAVDAANPIRDLRSYLLRITHHCVIDRRRRDGARDRAVARMEAEGPAWFAPAPDADTTAFRTALGTALAALPADQRAVVHLKLWEGRSFADIATLLDLPANTAASRYRYGIGKLRAALLPLYEEIRHLPQP